MDALSGARRWQTTLTLADATNAVAETDAGVVAVAAVYHLYGVDGTTGRLLWTRGDDAEWQSAGGRSYRLTTDGRSFYLDARIRNGVVAVAPVDGHVRWLHQGTGTPDGSVGTRVLVWHGGRLFTDFAVLDPETGKPVHAFEANTTGSHIAALDVSDAVIGVAYSDGVVVGLASGQSPPALESRQPGARGRANPGRWQSCRCVLADARTRCERDYRPGT